MTLVHSGASAVIPTCDASKTVADICRVCDGTGWVCENHNDRPWEGVTDREDACHCGAGSPCWICNREMALAGPLWTEREKAKALLDAILTKRDYVTDVIDGHLTGKSDLRDMARDDLERIDAAVRKARTDVEGPSVGTSNASEPKNTPANGDSQ